MTPREIFYIQKGIGPQERNLASRFHIWKGGQKHLWMVLDLDLFDCSITEEGCAALVSALKSKPSHLRELNLSLNNPGESGVKLLSDLLEDPHCKLEKLRLYGCRITEEGCAALVSALKSNPSHLKELNLGSNNPGKSGVKLLSDLLEDPHCKLEKLDVCVSCLVLSLFSLVLCFLSLPCVFCCPVS
ncbi:hypothetical protein NFI96_005413 [Prochilodus magdalenae]|nr:hypothetical protein NFI96_005413 [Prochilodus magdalenae]